MKLFYLVLILLGLTWACSSAVDAEAPDGRQLYKSYCVTCHGISGNMGASGAFDLSSSKLGLEERIQVITNGRNVMASYKSLLSEEQIRAVAEYTLQLTKTE
jgi:mono/diheme cytochrome c family protein